LLVDDFDHLLAAAAPPLDCQHGIVESTQERAGSVGEARRLDAVCLVAWTWAICL
jgi:hypothetical protein